MSDVINENGKSPEQMVTVKEDSQKGKTLIDHGGEDALVINGGRRDTEISSTSATDTDISSTWETDVELNAPWFQPPWYRPPIPVTKPLLTSTGVAEEVQLDIINSLQRDVETRLNKVAETSQRFDGIDRGLQKLYNEGIKNTANTITVVAVLIATVTFTAIFTVPGGLKSNGEAVMVECAAFKIFLVILCLIGGCTIAFTLGILCFLVSNHQFHKVRKQRRNRNPSRSSIQGNIQPVKEDDLSIMRSLTTDSDFAHAQNGFVPV